MQKLTEQQLGTAVHRVAAEIENIESATVSGLVVNITLAWDSGRRSVEASMQFDGETGRCVVISCLYQADKPGRFADEVERRLGLRR